MKLGDYWEIRGDGLFAIAKWAGEARIMILVAVRMPDGWHWLH